MILRLIKFLSKFVDTNEISDGYHTFGELYKHRDALFVQLMKENKDKAWWSKKHSDGTDAFGYPWVVAGIGKTPGKQVTYHLNQKRFGVDDLDDIQELDFAPIWDHHTSADVLFRIRTRGFRDINQQ